MNAQNRSVPGGLRKGQACKISYTLGSGGLQIAAAMDERPFPLVRAAVLFPSLEPLARLPGTAGSAGATASQLTVPPHMALAVLAALREAEALRTRGLMVHIDPQLLELKTGACPEGFHLDYHWMPAAARLTRALNNAAVYLGNGWFLQKSVMYPVPGLMPRDDAWLGRAEIFGRDLLTFLRDVYPRWKNRGVPVRTDAPFYPEPALEIHVMGLDRQMIALRVDWRVPAEALRSIRGVDQLVAEGTRMRPGIAAETLRRHLPATAGDCMITGESIVTFMKESFALLVPFITERAEEIERMHRLIEGACEVSLALPIETTRGVGRVYAEPVLAYPGGQTRALTVSRGLKPDSTYTRVDDGWVRTAAARRAGLDVHGKLADGTQIDKRLLLSPSEIFLQGGERLKGPWARVFPAQVAWMCGPGLPGWAQAHLDGLRRTGIAGGVVSAFGPIRGEVKAFVARYRREEPDAMLLVVAAGPLLAALTGEWADLAPLYYAGERTDPVFPRRMSGVLMATPHALEVYPELSGLPWDICIFLLPETLPMDPPDNVERLVRLGARLRLGVFGSDAFLYDPRLSEIMVRIFGVTQPDIHWRWALRYAERDWQLPTAAPMERAEFFPSGWEPIPTGSRATLPASDEVIATAAAGDARLSPEEQFVQTAMRLSTVAAQEAAYVPFTQPAPDFRTMNDAQMTWYSWFRARTRAGEFIHTDLPYVQIYLYEILNGIGWSQPETGLNLLMQAFSMHRGDWPELDETVSAWIVDFMAHYGLSEASAYGLIAEAAPEQNVDFLLTHSVETHRLTINARMLSMMTDPMMDDRILRNPTLGQHICRLVEGLDWAFWRDRHSGLMEMFGGMTPRRMTRQAFAGALYAGIPPQVTLTVTPYSRNAKLRRFLTHVTNYAGGELLHRLGMEGVRIDADDPMLEKIVKRYLDMYLKSGVSQTEAWMSDWDPDKDWQEEDDRFDRQVADKMRKFPGLQEQGAFPEVLPEAEDAGETPAADEAEAFPTAPADSLLSPDIFAVTTADIPQGFGEKPQRPKAVRAQSPAASALADSPWDREIEERPEYVFKRGEAKGASAASFGDGRNEDDEGLGTRPDGAAMADPGRSSSMASAYAASPSAAGSASASVSSATASGLRMANSEFSTDNGFTAEGGFSMDAGFSVDSDPFSPPTRPASVPAPAASAPGMISDPHRVPPDPRTVQLDPRISPGYPASANAAPPGGPSAISGPTAAAGTPQAAMGASAMASGNTSSSMAPGTLPSMASPGQMPLDGSAAAAASAGIPSQAMASDPASSMMGATAPIPPMAAAPNSGATAPFQPITGATAATPTPPPAAAAESAPVESASADIWTGWLTGSDEVNAVPPAEPWDDLPPIEQFMQASNEAEAEPLDGLAPAQEDNADMGKLSAALRALSDPHAAVLWHLRQYAWETSAERIRAAMPAYVVEDLVDQINDQVYSSIDDLLIEEMTDVLSVVSAYRDAVSAMLDERSRT